MVTNFLLEVIPPCIMSVQYTRGCSVHWGFHTNSIVFQWPFPTFIVISPMTFPHIYRDIPHDLSPYLSCYFPPVYSWYLPLYSWYPSSVLNIPRCTAHLQCTAQTLCRMDTVSQNKGGDKKLKFWPTHSAISAVWWWQCLKRLLWKLSHIRINIGLTHCL